VDWTPRRPRHQGVTEVDVVGQLRTSGVRAPLLVHIRVCHERLDMTGANVETSRKSALDVAENAFDRSRYGS